ncbi:unnamed protein product [Rodentolepis nana]|uniref:Inhibitor_I29 domain-containing protein n=1 Tax=Rodentolepis nana TaxID=102285 RepID=A0A0R3T943_RODNA|nr:unnamed protein product [Rodentolepis nana]
MCAVTWLCFVILLTFSTGDRLSRVDEENAAHYRFIQEYEGQIRHNQNVDRKKTEGKKMTLLELSRLNKERQVTPQAA